MISIRRMKSPQGLSYIKDRLMDTGDLPKDFLLAKLESMLKEADPSLLILVAVKDDDKKGQRVVGHAIATLPANVDYAFIYEAEYDTKLSVDDGVEIMTRSKRAVIDWIAKNNRVAFRMETKRNPEVWQRKWGMKPIATVMEYRLDSELNDQIFEEVETSRKDREDGRRNINQVRTDGRTEVDHLDHEEDPSAGGRERSEARSGVRVAGAGSDTVQGSSDGGSPQGVREDSSGGDADRPVDGISDYHERYISATERPEGLRLP